MGVGQPDRPMTAPANQNDNGRPEGQPLRISIVFDGTTETSQSGFYHPSTARSRGRPNGQEVRPIIV